MSSADEHIRVELVGIEVSNLRNFRSTRLSVREGLMLLVGPNNSGKTSLLRLMNWVLNVATEEQLIGDASLSDDDLALLMPARRTGNLARRLTLFVHVLDGRRARRFQAEDGVARLRVGVSAEGKLRLNIGAPVRGESSDSKSALTLIRAVRRCTEFSLVPSSRDAASESFARSMRTAITARLEERAIHAKRAGAPAEYRQVKRALGELEAIGRELVAPLWEDMRRSLPAGLARSGELRVSVTPEDFVPWLAGQVALRLTTGEHDEDTVPPVEVGSGLQSMLELSSQQAAASITGASRILAIEEPEAFLHPSAQRTLARQLAASLPGKRIVSTHSPLVIEEASYGEVVLVREHRYFEPRLAPDDETRARINTALLTGFGAEMAFARSVLLVEGEGDRLYFDGLRRRLAAASGDGRIDELFVVPTGSKTSFAPWLRMLTSYGEENDRPIAWLAVPDGDAATEIARAWRDGGVAVPTRVDRALRALASLGTSSTPAAIKATAEANRVARSHGIGIHLMPCDLERVMLTKMSPQTENRIRELLEVPPDADTQAWLRNRKAPWMRALIAKETPWAEVSNTARTVLRRALEPVIPRASMTRAFRRATTTG
jgi:hypothetical protein